jgi:carboxyl-terminal processing protease
VGEKRINYKPSMPDLENDSKILRFVGVLIIVVCVASLSFVGGRLFEQKSEYSYVNNWENFSQEDFESSLFWDVWNILKAEYVDEEAVDSEEMFYGAIKGMVSSLDDPATVFLNAEETETFRKQTQGKHFEGIGAELGYKDGVIVVISPLEGSPAKAAGVLPGAVILKVDGEDVKRSDTVYDVVKKIRGEKGTGVVLDLAQGPDMELEEITIVRDEITIPSMSFEQTGEGDIYTIKVGRFTEASLPVWNAVWDKTVDEFLETGADKLILDLRGNPGGFFDASLYAAAEFLKENTVIAKQEDRKGETQDYKVSRKGRLLDVDVVVLVNEGSASSSEILAGALQKNNRAQVLGVETYGKGTAQRLIDLYDGSSLHLTIVKWLLPDGIWLNPENVIIPDIEVELTVEDFEAGDDPQLEKAIEILKK